VRVIQDSAATREALRGLVERDRKLLGLLSQTAYASILKCFQSLFDRPDVPLRLRHLPAQSPWSA